MTCIRRRVMTITIETFSVPTAYTFRAYRDNLPTFLINAAPVRYYAFETVDGAEERFLYADIRHISFTEEL